MMIQILIDVITVLDFKMTSQCDKFQKKRRADSHLVNELKNVLTLAV